MLGAKFERYPPSAATVSTCKRDDLAVGGETHAREPCDGRGACASDTRHSERVAVHFTGRFRRPAAQADGRDLDRKVDLQAKAASYVGSDHPDPVLRHEQSVDREPALR